jgi:hypothetical protein
VTPDDTYRTVGRPTREQSARLARALIRQAKAGCCPCGVLPQDCADHRPQPETEPSEETADA